MIAGALQVTAHILIWSNEKQNAINVRNLKDIPGHA